MPTELDAVSRKIIQMEIEEAALKKEEDELSKRRLAELQKDTLEKRALARTVLADDAKKIALFNAERNTVDSLCRVVIHINLVAGNHTHQFSASFRLL